MKISARHLFRKASKGFTLVELIVVMAVLGVLAAITIAAVNPAEQFARGRDAQRKTTVAQLAHAMQSYATLKGGTFYDNYGANSTSTWIDTSVSNGAGGTKDLQSTPNDPGGTVATPCPATVSTATQVNVSRENSYCYMTNGTGANATQAVIWVGLESKAEASKCTTAGTTPFFLWSSADGKAGTVCVGATGIYNAGTPASSVFSGFTYL